MSILRAERSVLIEEAMLAAGYENAPTHYMSYASPAKQRVLLLYTALLLRQGNPFHQALTSDSSHILASS